jgi:hypothetical protein
VQAKYFSGISKWCLKLTANFDFYFCYPWGVRRNFCTTHNFSVENPIYQTKLRGKGGGATALLPPSPLWAAMKVSECSFKDDEQSKLQVNCLQKELIVWLS